jgi:hypothetical protein
MCRSGGIVVKSSASQTPIRKPIGNTPKDAFWLLSYYFRVNLQNIELVITAIPGDANKVVLFMVKVNQRESRFPARFILRP